MANPIEAAQIAAVAAKVTTIGTARAAMRRCIDLLEEAKAKVADAHFYDESFDARQDDLKQALTARLEVVRAYAAGHLATGVYKTTDPDLQEEEISVPNAARVGIIMAQTADALIDVEDSLRENVWDFPALLSDTVVEAARQAGEAVQGVAGAAVKAAAAAASAFVAAAWRTIAVVGVAVGVYVWFRAGRPGMGSP
jgi:hypothetical protein